MTLPAGSVHACTDITGFGFIGHASEMAAGSGVTLEIEVGAVPFIRGAFELAANRSGGMKSNERHFAGGVVGLDGIDPATADLLFDPQTSGGLLAAVDPAAADQAAAVLAAAGVLAARVGTAAVTTGEYLRLLPSFRSPLVV
jgi:selenide,water dikinase